jgi:hypothetical protein
LKRLFQKPGHHSKWVNITFWVAVLLYVSFVDRSTGDDLSHIGVFRILLLSDKLSDESNQMPVVWMSHLCRDNIVSDNYQLPLHVNSLSYLVLFADNPHGRQRGTRQWQSIVVRENKDTVSDMCSFVLFSSEFVESVLQIDFGMNIRLMLKRWGRQCISVYGRHFLLYVFYSQRLLFLWLLRTEDFMVWFILLTTILRLLPEL